MLLTVTLISAVIIFIEGVPLFKKKMWKEFITVLTLLIIAIFLVVEHGLGIPTPIDIANKLLYPLGRTVFRLH
ncbi:hypothetical protein [Clostridium sp. JS66]|uniref:hypothetical protein n=1 Tax=Clostridium sp. JS66 TaxID=3064705 RepID=UPI00298E412E|nr:hypothetical protein [Clostridium sp. JS66]WPC41679.1 hypothetical protein Q6H37_28070 [Clostridium sp. JS66]